MTAFLWVEDFDGGAFRDTTNDVFGTCVGDRSAIPDEKEDLRDYLGAKGIYLETSLAAALNFIEDRDKLATIDFVILDIDLRISDDPDDEVGNTYLDGILDWYASLQKNEQRSKLKAVAGYHLWTRLVIDHGFPRDRIQFCSQHGEYQESIKDSFTPARITPPDVFRKGDGRTKAWITQQIGNTYVRLRRCVVDYCGIVSRWINCKSASADIIRLSRMPGESTRDFKAHHAIEMMEMLPRYLPSQVPADSVQEVLRAFVRALTFEWERFSASKNDLAIYQARIGKSYNKAIESRFRAGASVLKLIRNTLAHSSNKPVRMLCEHAALTFVLNMQVVFVLEGLNDLKLIENKLLTGNTFNSGECCAEEVRVALLRSQSSVSVLASSYHIPLVSDDGKARSVGELLRRLQDSAATEYQQDASIWTLRMLWHELAYGFDDARKFADRFDQISHSHDPIYRVAMAALKLAFHFDGSERASVLS